VDVPDGQVGFRIDCVGAAATGRLAVRAYRHGGLFIL
jgi:hypothetical protein